METSGDTDGSQVPHEITRSRELLTQAAYSDAESRSKLMRRAGSLIREFRLTGPDDPRTAEDLLAAVVEKAWRSGPRIESLDHAVNILKLWMQKFCIDAARRRRRQSQSEPLDQDLTAPTALDDPLLTRRVNAYISSLPPGKRAELDLRRQGYGLKEICEYLGRDVKYVPTLSRNLKRIGQRVMEICGLQEFGRLQKGRIWKRK